MFVFAIKNHLKYHQKNKKSEDKLNDVKHSNILLIRVM